MTFVCNKKQGTVKNCFLEVNTPWALIIQSFINGLFFFDGNCSVLVLLNQFKLSLKMKFL